MVAVGLCLTGASALEARAEPVECALTVRFGSYAMGVDRKAVTKIEQYLRAQRSVRAIDRRPWGREGEFDLCVRTARPTEAKRLFDRVRRMLPPDPRGPISLRLADGRSFDTPPRK